MLAFTKNPDRDPWLSPFRLGREPRRWKAHTNCQLPSLAWMQPSLRLNDRCCEIQTARSERAGGFLCHYRGVTTTKTDRTRSEAHNIHPGLCRLTRLENWREGAIALNLVDNFPVPLRPPPHALDRVDNRVVPPVGIERGVHLSSLLGILPGPGGMPSPRRRPGVPGCRTNME